MSILNRPYNYRGIEQRAMNPFPYIADYLEKTAALVRQRYTMPHSPNEARLQVADGTGEKIGILSVSDLRESQITFQYFSLENQIMTTLQLKKSIVTGIPNPDEGYGEQMGMSWNEIMRFCIRTLRIERTDKKGLFPDFDFVRNIEDYHITIACDPHEIDVFGNTPNP